jgi:hypothetical protein
MSELWQDVEPTPSESEALRHPCILWTLSVDSKGYGQVKIPHTRKNARVHRVAYEEAYGPIPQGLEVIHTCRVKRCVQPWHLVAVTPKQRMLAADLWDHLVAWSLARPTCKHGHPFDGVFHEGRKDGRPQRYCRTCNRDKMRQRRANDARPT